MEYCEKQENKNYTLDEKHRLLTIGCPPPSAGMDYKDAYKYIQKLYSDLKLKKHGLERSYEWINRKNKKYEKEIDELKHEIECLKEGAENDYLDLEDECGLYREKSEIKIKKY